MAVCVVFSLSVVLFPVGFVLVVFPSSSVAGVRVISSLLLFSSMSISGSSSVVFVVCLCSCCLSVCSLSSCVSSFSVVCVSWSVSGVTLRVALSDKVFCGSVV